MPRAQKIDSVSDIPVTVAVGVAEIESIVEKAIAAATTVIRTELDKALQEFHNRLSSVESRMDKYENIKLPEAELSDLSNQLEAMKKEYRQFARAANDSEQYSRRNNIRIKGLSVKKDDDCPKIVVDFIRGTLNCHIEDSDIESAHPLPIRPGTSSGSTLTPGSQTRNSSRPQNSMVMVRFRNRSIRDNVITRRKVLKGTNCTIVEDLTSLNVETMNRLRNSEHVQKTWSWNGHIYAILHDGKKICVQPFESLVDCVRRHAHLN
jgi:hypothetical protein